MNSSRVWRRKSHFRMLFIFRNRTLHNLQHHCSTLETCYSAVGNDAGESTSSTRTCSVLCELKYSRARWVHGEWNRLKFKYIFIHISFCARLHPRVCRLSQQKVACVQTSFCVQRLWLTYWQLKIHNFYLIFKPIQLFH